MISGLPVSQLQRLIRKRGRTHASDLEHGLGLIGKRGVVVMKLRPGAELPVPSILRVRGKSIDHWVIWTGQHILDPEIGTPALLAGFKRFRLGRHACRFTMAITWSENGGRQ